MNTPNVILAEKAISGKSTNNVWVVYTSADSTDKMYCTSPYKAMRLMFLLKKRTTCKSVWITHRFLLVETRRTFCL